LIELECCEEVGDYVWEADPQVGINLEIDFVNLENEFDSNFVSHIILEESFGDQYNIINSYKCIMHSK
jgi:hypothetical protein